MFPLLFIRTMLTTLLFGVLAYLLFVAYTNYAGYLSNPTGFKPANPIHLGMESLHIQPCQNEDASDFFLPIDDVDAESAYPEQLSVPCQWNAHTSGNGQGMSFWVDTNNNAYYYDVFPGEGNI